jgi:D-alanyl-D-alanine carboxypeptidase
MPNHNLDRLHHSYLIRIRATHQTLGIPPDYGVSSLLPAYFESEQLVSAGKDIYDRDVFLTTRTLQAWNALRSAARADSHSLVIVSGFRSVKRQQEIIGRKIKNGESMSMILSVNAAPGYSQHHTGCAIDLTNSDSRERPLEEDFELTPSFEWLNRRAGDFGFRLVYTRDNPWGFIYEPWHWAYAEVQEYELNPSENNYSG